MQILGGLAQKCLHHWDDQKGWFPNRWSIPCLKNPPSQKINYAPTILLKASTTTLGNLSHLLSLSTTQILACAHHLLDLPLIDTGTPEPNILTELNTSAELSKSPDPKVQPFDTLTSIRYKKAANHVHPIWTTLPEEHHILHHIPSNPLIPIPVFPNTLQTSFLLRNLLKKEWRNEN